MMTPTADHTSTLELTGSPEPSRPEREAALSTLEQMGLATMPQSAYGITGTRTPVPTTPAPASATITFSTPVSGSANEGDGGDTDALQRSAADAGRDAIALLIISGGMLLALYWSMKRNVRSRKFSKYK
jgi:hypothetical protein